MFNLSCVVSLPARSRLYGLAASPVTAKSRRWTLRPARFGTDSSSRLKGEAMGQVPFSHWVTTRNPTRQAGIRHKCRIYGDELDVWSGWFQHAVHSCR